MRTVRRKEDGAILGLEREIETEALFVTDARGPRTSPAIEVQEWIEPAPVGRPYAAPNEVGIHAIGVGVRDLDAALARLARLGGERPGKPAPAKELFGGRAASLGDPRGVAVDLVEQGGLAEGETRLRHLRLACSDLDRSLAWYAELGFEALARPERLSVAELFGSAPGDVRAARLRLPDEPLELVLVQWLDPPATGRPYREPYHAGLYRMAIAVDDTRDAMRRLEAARRPIERPPRRVALEGTRVPEMWIAFLGDPDGVPVELVERPRSAFR
jgi:catechol 2,3-dioxygenase-like lactoylglutathione lyase family enzyme